MRETDLSKIKNFFTGPNYRRNSARLLNICKELIEKYQTNNCKPSAETDLLELIGSRVTASKAEISEWRDSDTDYIKIAHTMLAHATFDLLASGAYHIYSGMLNPMSCADNLMDIYKACMEYGIQTKLLDEKTREEQYEYLLQCISEVG
jgi:hypothetical protein